MKMIFFARRACSQARVLLVAVVHSVSLGDLWSAPRITTGPIFFKYVQSDSQPIRFQSAQHDLKFVNCRLSNRTSTDVRFTNVPKPFRTRELSFCHFNFFQMAVYRKQKNGSENSPLHEQCKISLLNFKNRQKLYLCRTPRQSYGILMLTNRIAVLGQANVTHLAIFFTFFSLMNCPCRCLPETLRVFITCRGL